MPWPGFRPFIAVSSRNDDLAFFLHGPVQPCVVRDLNRKSPSLPLSFRSFGTCRAAGAVSAKRHYALGQNRPLRV
jgi:hypothetical protein